MTRAIFISLFIYTIVAAGLFGSGFAVGNSKATNNNLTAQLAEFRESCKESMAVGLDTTYYLSDDDGIQIPGLSVNCHQKGVSDQQLAEQMFERENPLRINAECHGDASDWATIRMANEIGYAHALPVFVHGNCLTHSIKTVLPTYDGNIFLCNGKGHENDQVKVFGGTAITPPPCQITNTPSEEGQ